MSSDGRLRELLADSWALNLQMAARIGSLEGLLAELEQQGVAPSELVDLLVREMPEEDLYTLLDELASLDRRSLEEIEDIQAFASRLASIALEGTFEPNDESADGDAGTILFATERKLTEPEAVAQDSFSSEERSIYAIIPVGEWGGESSVIKWIRLDRPEFVSFRRITLRSDGGTHYSYGQHRSIALEPGRYKVGVYATDQALTPIASGYYEVD